MDKQHKAKFMGKVGKVRYKFNRYLYSVDAYLDNIEWRILEEVGLDNPPLDIEDKVYLVSLQKSAKIIDIMRSTDNSYVYYTNHVVERIEDEETPKSKEEAEKEMKDFIAKRFVEDKTPNEQEDVKEDQPKKKWYQFWK